MEANQAKAIGIMEVVFSSLHDLLHAHIDDHTSFLLQHFFLAGCCRLFLSFVLAAIFDAKFVIFT